MNTSRLPSLQDSANILVQIVKFESKCNAPPFQDGNQVFPGHLWGEPFIDTGAARNIGQLFLAAAFLRIDNSQLVSISSRFGFNL